MTFKEKLRLNKKRALSGLFILFFLSSSLIAITPRRAYAAPVPLSPAEKAAAYQAASAIKICAERTGWSNDRSSSELNNGNVLLNRRTDFVDNSVSVGFLIPANSDGLFGCVNLDHMQGALKAMGVKGVDFFTDAKIYEPKSGGDGYQLVKDKSAAEYSSSIDRYFANKFGFSLNSDLPTASQYFNLKKTFEKKCAAGVVSSGNAGRDVKIVDEKGEITTKRYELNRLDVSHRVGFGMSNDGGSDGFMKCDNIVSSMNSYANDASTVQKAAVAAGASQGTVGSDADTAAADDKSCENRGGVSSWFACPLITLVAESLQWVDEQIQTLMVVNPNYYQTGQGAENLYKAWTAFRNIALSLLIAAMMVIVISTALGVGVLDAYTVKKAFPRLIASVIFILLSWWLCVFMIDFFNVIGQGILGVMTSPFGLSGDKTILSLFNTSAGEAAGQGLIALIAGAGLFLVTGAIGILISWIGTALLVMLIAFLVLVARQMFIITLILFAPLAILAWIFPSTSKIWKFWWESFTKVLIMYPMVMALIGAGRIFASVINDQQTTPAGEGVAGGSLLLPMAKLAAYVIPYAFIPFTFKAAGGLFGNLAGMANDRGRGTFDRLRKGRQKNMAEIGQRTRTGQMTKGANRFTNRLNRGARGAMAGPSSGFGLGTRGRIFDDEQASVEAAEIKKTAAWQGAQFKDNTMRALTHTSESSARADLVSRGITGAALDEALIGAKQIGYGRTSQIAAAQQLAVNKTGYDNAADAMSLVDRVAGNNGTLRASLRENVKFTSKQVGRNDLGALSDRQAGETEQQWNTRMTMAGFENLDPYALGREHSNSAVNMAAVQSLEYDSAVRDYAAATTDLSSPDPAISASAQTRQAQARDRIIAVRAQVEETMKNANSATGNNARVALRLTQAVAGTDEQLRSIDPALANSPLTKTSLGSGGGVRGQSVDPRSRDN